MSDDPKPTHVLVGASDGEKLVGERFVTFAEFVELLLTSEAGKRLVVLRGATGPMGPPGPPGPEGRRGPTGA